MAFDYATLPKEEGPASNFGFTSQLDRPVENQLAAAVKRGETAPFEELCRSHAEKLLRTTYRITKNREDAEDAQQDSFLKAFVHLEDFDGRSSFSTWLTRMAINSALMLLRKRRSPLEISIDDPGDVGRKPAFLELPDSAPNPEASCAQREREEILQGAISGLRPTIRQALELKKLHQYSLEETAQMMGLSVPAAKSRLHQAQAELRKSLTPKNIHRALANGGVQFAPVG